MERKNYVSRLKDYVKVGIATTYAGLALLLSGCESGEGGNGNVTLFRARTAEPVVENPNTLANRQEYGAQMVNVNGINAMLYKDVKEPNAGEIYLDDERAALEYGQSGGNDDYEEPSDDGGDGDGSDSGSFGTL